MINTCGIVDYGAIKSTILETKILRWKVKFEVYFPKFESIVKS